MMIRRRAAYLTGLALVASLAACGPVPVDQAERSCLRDARLAQHPRGSVTMGVGGGDGGGLHTMGRVSVEVSDDYIMGRDPSEVFTRCVINRSGQMPTVPLESQPGWRG